MLDTLPQFMQDLWPWILWLGGAGVVLSIFFDLSRRMRRHRKGKSMVDE